MSFSGVVNRDIYQEDEIAKLLAKQVNYEVLVKLNSELKTNPFLGHITITEARSGYVFFDSGNRNCPVEQLITAIKNKQGYITNISLLRGSIEAYNNNIKKKAEKLKLKSEIESRKVLMQVRQRLTPRELADKDKENYAITDSFINNTLKEALVNKVNSLYGEVNNELIDAVLKGTFDSRNANTHDEFVDYQDYILYASVLDKDYLLALCTAAYTTLLIGYYFNIIFKEDFTVAIKNSGDYSNLRLDEEISCDLQSSLNENGDYGISYWCYSLQVNGLYDFSIIFWCSDLSMPVNEIKRLGLKNYKDRKKYTLDYMLDNLTLSYSLNTQWNDILNSIIQSSGVAGFKESDYCDNDIDGVKGFKSLVKYCKYMRSKATEKKKGISEADFSNFENKLKSLVAKTGLVFGEDFYKRIVKFNLEALGKVEDNFDYFCKLVAMEYFGGVATSLLWDNFNSIIEEKFQQRGISTKKDISEDNYHVDIDKDCDTSQTNYWIIINEWFDLTSIMEGQFTFEGYIESDGKTADSISITIEPRRGFSKEYDSLLVSIFNSIKTPLNDYDNFTFTTSSIKDIMEFIKKIKEA